MIQFKENIWTVGRPDGRMVLKTQLRIELLTLNTDVWNQLHKTLKLTGIVSNLPIPNLSTFLFKMFKPLGSF